MDLKILLPDYKIEHNGDYIFMTLNKQGLIFNISTPNVVIVNRIKNTQLYKLLFDFTRGFVSENRILSKYYSIENFNPVEYKPFMLYVVGRVSILHVDILPKLTNILNCLIKNQKEKELLLEEVLRSKKNIDGLIENMIRSFVYYNIKLI
jgi:hypothetical protein